MPTTQQVFIVIATAASEAGAQVVVESVHSTDNRAKGRIRRLEAEGHQNRVWSYQVRPAHLGFPKQPIFVGPEPKLAPPPESPIERKQRILAGTASPVDMAQEFLSQVAGGVYPSAKAAQG